MTNSSRFFDLIDELDVIIEAEPTRESAQRLLELFQDEALKEYALERVQRPSWLPYLQAGSVFADPPSTRTFVARDGKEYSLTPFWPASRLLARMALVAPTEIIAIVLQIPPTDNGHVHQDVFEVLAALSTQDGLPILEKETSWLAEQDYLQFGLADTIAKVIIKYSGPQGRRSLFLAEITLAVHPGLEMREQTGEDQEILRLPPTPRGRIDPYEYGRLAGEILGPLILSEPKATLEMFSSLLEQALKYSLLRDATESGYEDYSYIWYPRLGSENIKRGDSVRDILVAATRQSAHECVSRERLTLDECIGLLDARKFTVFRRLAIDLVITFSDSGSEIARSFILTRDVFSNPSFKAEYGALAKREAPFLEKDDTKTLLEWIREDAGSDEDNSRWYENLHGARPSSDQLRLIRDTSLRDRLALFGAEAPPSMSGWLKQLIEAVGPPRKPLVDSGLAWGEEESPIGLKGKTARQIVDATKEWDAAHDKNLFRDFAYTSQLTGLATEWSFDEHVCAALEELDARYATPVLEALRQAIDSKAELSWRDVLPFAKWAIEESIASSATDPDEEWTAVRRTAIRFVARALSADKPAIPTTFRSTVWQIIEPLTRDPEPGDTDEQASMDAATLSINSVRGEAMHAAVRYGLWIFNAFPETQKPTLENGLGELTIVLDRHLDLGTERSPAIRSIYGQWFPWLLRLGPTWAEKNVSAIFGHDTDDRLGETAWLSYIAFSQPYDAVLEVLQDVYARAINRVGTRSPTRNSFADPDRRLGEHLAAYYWRGILNTQSKRELLDGYLLQAPPPARAHLIQFVGRSVSNTKELPPKIGERLRKLLEERTLLLSVQTRLSGNAETEELVPFGWWFVTNHFRRDWSISQLLSVLRLTNGQIEPEHEVIDELRKFTDEFPVETIRALSAILLAPKDWGRHYPDAVTQILQSAIRSGNTAAREEADDLIQNLGRTLRRFELRGLAREAKLLSEAS